MAAIAVLLLVAAVSIIMFIRSWRQAGARARTERIEQMERRMQMQQRLPPADAEDVSWTRGRLDVRARATLGAGENRTEGVRLMEGGEPPLPSVRFPESRRASPDDEGGRRP